MAELMQASRQWASRPPDERYLSLDDMQTFCDSQREASRARVVPSKHLNVVPQEDNVGLTVLSGQGEHAPTNWSFNQLAKLAASSPPGYLRTLPAPIVADALNYQLRFNRQVEDVGVLLQDDSHELRAATGPNYGRIWNADVVRALREKFGDGVTGDWKVPGEFGKDVIIDKGNTTLYAGDRDMFVFLADEKNRITVPNRRNGQSGTMARGFFAWNSEVGKTTAGLGTFLFDFVCQNRIVWGADAYEEIKIRHTVSAPDKWLDKVMPVLLTYANGSAKPYEDAIVAAQSKKVDDVAAFLGERFGKRLVMPMLKVHEIEEGRPVETLWDAATAATAYARGLEHIDARVEIEREAGKVMALAA